MSSSLHERLLLNLLLDECSLQEMADACARLLGAPLRFVFHQGQEGFVSSAEMEPAEALLEQQIIDAQLTRHGLTLPMYLARLLETRGLTPFIANTDQTGLSRRLLVCVAGAGGGADGLLSLPEARLPLEDIDPALVALCARCLALCLHQRRWNLRPVRFRLAMNLLVSGRCLSYQDVLHEAGIQTPPEFGRYHLLSIRCLTPREENTLAALAGQLAFALKTDWLYVEQRSAQLLFEACNLTAGFDNRLMTLLRLSGCAACLSPEYVSLLDTALWRSRISRLPPFLKAESGQLVRYSDHLDWGLMAESRLRPEALDGFVPAPLKTLREIDQRENTGYLPTLTAYFENHLSKKQTALALGLHVNTVSYRLERIQQVTGVLADDPKALFTLPAALRLMQYQEALKPGRDA